jgi:hypothetical protein
MSIEKLLKTNVNEHIEKKNNLSYLSWAWAWAEALKADPSATYQIALFDEHGADGRKRTVPYMNINDTAMVMVTVTIFGKAMTCQLPVMDHRNKAIPNPDAFAVNTAHMRCMTKALSLHGLGLYIYAGEDLPEEGPVPASVKHSPRGGIGEDLPAEEKEYLKTVADILTTQVAEGNVGRAYERLTEENLEAEQKVYLWDQLDSKTRSALKKAKEAAN